MKKKVKSLEIDLPPCRLYYDDIEVIIAAFTGEGSTVEIETDDYTTGELKELKDVIIDPIYKLAIVSKKPEMRVWFAGARSMVMSPVDTAQTRGLAARVQEVAARRRTPRGIVFAAPGAIAFFIAVLFEKSLLSTSLILMGCGMGLLGYGVYVSVRHHSSIILRSRREAPSFWERNKEEFFKDALKAGSGLIIGYLAGRFGGS